MKSQLVLWLLNTTVPILPISTQDFENSSASEKENLSFLLSLVIIQANSSKNVHDKTLTLCCSECYSSQQVASNLITKLFWLRELLHLFDLLLNFNQFIMKRWNKIPKNRKIALLGVGLLAVVLLVTGCIVRKDGLSNGNEVVVANEPETTQGEYSESYLWESERKLVFAVNKIASEQNTEYWTLSATGVKEQIDESELKGDQFQRRLGISETTLYSEGEKEVNGFAAIYSLVSPNGKTSVTYVREPGYAGYIVEPSGLVLADNNILFGAGPHGWIDSGRLLFEMNPESNGGLLAVNIHTGEMQPVDISSAYMRPVLVDGGRGIIYVTAGDDGSKDVMFGHPDRVFYYDIKTNKETLLFDYFDGVDGSITNISPVGWITSDPPPKESQSNTGNQDPGQGLFSLLSAYEHPDQPVMKLPWPASSGINPVCVSRKGPDPGSCSSSGSFCGLQYGPHSSNVVDFDTPNGTEDKILAAAGGKVVFANSTCCKNNNNASYLNNCGAPVSCIGQGWGKFVVIDHGAINGNHHFTLYAHLSFVLVNEGDQVCQGGVIGDGGNTQSPGGNNCCDQPNNAQGHPTGGTDHLHFEYRVGNDWLVGAQKYYARFDEVGCSVVANRSYTSQNIMQANCCIDPHEPNNTASDASTPQELYAIGQATQATTQPVVLSSCFDATEQHDNEYFLLSLDEVGELVITPDAYSRVMLVSGDLSNGGTIIAGPTNATLTYCKTDAVCAPLYLQVRPQSSYSGENWSVNLEWEPNHTCASGSNLLGGLIPIANAASIGCNPGCIDQWEPDEPGDNVEPWGSNPFTASSSGFVSAIFTQHDPLDWSWSFCDLPNTNSGTVTVVFSNPEGVPMDMVIKDHNWADIHTFANGSDATETYSFTKTATADRLIFMHYSEGKWGGNPKWSCGDYTISITWTPDPVAPPAVCTDPDEPVNYTTPKIPTNSPTLSTNSLNWSFSSKISIWNEEDVWRIPVSLTTGWDGVLAVSLTPSNDQDLTLQSHIATTAGPWVGNGSSANSGAGVPEVQSVTLDEDAGEFIVVVYWQGRYGGTPPTGGVNPNCLDYTVNLGWSPSYTAPQACSDPNDLSDYNSYTMYIPSGFNATSFATTVTFQSIIANPTDMDIVEFRTNNIPGTATVYVTPPGGSSPEFILDFGIRPIENNWSWGQGSDSYSNGGGLAYVLSASQHGLIIPIWPSGYFGGGIAGNYSCNPYTITVVWTPNNPSTGLNPCDAIPLSSNTSCVWQTYSTIGNNSFGSNLTRSSCTTLTGSTNSGGSPQSPKWFKYTQPANGSIVSFAQSAGYPYTDLVAEAFVKFSGDCVSGTEFMASIGCSDSEPTTTNYLPEIDPGVVAGTEIYIAVWEWNNNNNGLFQMCVSEGGATSRLAAQMISEIETGIILKPNPAHDFLTVVIPEHWFELRGLQAIGLDGRVLESWDVDQFNGQKELKLNLDATRIPEGISVIRAWTDKESSAKRLVIIH